MDPHDTIVARASAPGGAPRGVVRISGTRAVDIAAGLAVGSLKTPRHACVVPAEVQLAADRLLPVELHVWPDTRSYTREPTVELHTIGSPPLLDLLVQRITSSGARIAEPGEFTLRAFLAGRLDLTQAEAVLGVIDANGQAALDTALEQLAGGIARPLATLREELLILLADLEAGLDFADEDIEFIAADVLAERLQSAANGLRKLSQQLSSRSVAGGLPRVILYGQTNVGKSSLFNALLAKFSKVNSTSASHAAATPAIVSPQPGATRDFLTAEVSLAGVACQLVDTAGIELLGSDATPGTKAQDMTKAEYARGTLILHCSDQPSELTRLAGLNELNVLTKCDLDSSAKAGPYGIATSGIATSAASGAGLDALAEAVALKLNEVGCTSMAPSTAARSESSVRLAIAALESAQSLASAGESEELVAAELRLSLSELGQIAGVVYTDDVLDRVFSRFCIGK